jgi:hypothetical protein
MILIDFMVLKSPADEEMSPQSSDNGLFPDQFNPFTPSTAHAVHQDLHFPASETKPKKQR